MSNNLLGPLFQDRDAEPIRIILRDGFIRIEPSIPQELFKALKYYHREFATDPDNKYKRIIKGEYHNLFDTDFYMDDKQNIVNFMITLPGFKTLICNKLKELGYRYSLIDKRTPMPPVHAKEAMMGLYEHQQGPVLDLIMAGGGVAACPTGFGKTHMMAALIRCFKHADLQARNTPITVVTADTIDVTKKNYNDLRNILPDREVGLVCTGRKKWSDDIQVITLGSLENIDPQTVGLFIADEVHASATNKRAETISRFIKAMRYGLSATPMGRFDGGDLKTVGLFGPVVVDIPYSYGVEVGALVPITVYFVKCPTPCIGLQQYRDYTQRTAKVRHGIDDNMNLNDLVAKIVNRIPDAMQTMLIMPHQLQLNELKTRLPHVTDVHATSNVSELNDKGYTQLTAVKPKDRERIYAKMESGEIRRVMATYVYKQGVNFPQLEVMICPGGGGSAIVSGQVPGRASRRITGKDASYIIDFWHPWDTIVSNPLDPRKKDGPLLRDDKSRDIIYKKLGFNRVWVDSIDELPFLLPTS